MKIYPVVNVSKVAMYQEQVKGQKKILSSLIEIDEENIE